MINLPSIFPSPHGMSLRLALPLGNLSCVGDGFPNTSFVCLALSVSKDIYQ